MFGFSADSVGKNALPEVLAVLKELFPASRWEAVKRHRGEKWNPDEVDKIAHKLDMKVKAKDSNGKKRDFVIRARGSFYMAKINNSKP